MAINFTKAIELEVVRKLKSHAKVGYQDHPNGDKRCSASSMLLEATPPACTHVAPPIASHGYCDDYEPLDPNARARAAIGKAKSFAEVLKDGPPDESRDNQGKWTTGSGVGQGTTRQSGRTGGRIAGRRGQSVSTYLDAELRREERQQARDEKQMADAQQKVNDLQRQLSEHSQDKSEDLYWGIHRMYQQAVTDLHELHQQIFGKAFSKAFDPGEPRDEKGRCTAGDSPGHPDQLNAEDSSKLAAAMEDVPQGMHDSVDHIEEARQALQDATDNADDVASEEEPILDEHGANSKEYAAWEKQLEVAQRDSADKAMALHKAIEDHMDATTGVLGQVRARLSTHVEEYGGRVGKSMTVGDVHAATALGNQSPNKRKAKDFLTTIGEINGARVMAIPAMNFGKALEKIKADVLGGIAIPVEWGKNPIAPNLTHYWPV